MRKKIVSAAKPNRILHGSFGLFLSLLLGLFLIACDDSSSSEKEDDSPSALSVKDNGDGTITTSLTGMSLTWEKSGSTSTFSFADAGTHCSGLTFAGHSDWRVPTLFEMLSMADYSQSPVELHSEFALPAGHSNHYWSATTTPGDANEAGAVHPTPRFSLEANVKTGNNINVLCVRGSVPTTVTLTDNGDGTVTSTVGGSYSRTWEKLPNAADHVLRNLTASTSRCEGLSLAGKSWRLPSFLEILLISSPGEAGGVNATFFPNVPNGNFWTATEAPTAGGRKASFSFRSIDQASSLPTSNLYSRCVSG